MAPQLAWPLELTWQYIKFVAIVVVMRVRFCVQWILLLKMVSIYCAIGIGHVNPSRANNPRLIYDIQPNNYVSYLCGLNYTNDQIFKIVDYDVQCSKVSSIAQAKLNYPSFFILLGITPQTYNRTVTIWAKLTHPMFIKLLH